MLQEAITENGRVTLCYLNSNVSSWQEKNIRQRRRLDQVEGIYDRDDHVAKHVARD
jgi:hypothetical protein